MPVLRAVERKYKQANQALERNDPAAAVHLFQELVERDPDQPLFQWSLGYALSEMGEYKRAIAVLRQALKLDPHNVPALGCLGRVYMELGAWKRAEKAFRNRLALKKSPQHYVFLADVLMKTGRYEEAIECCRQAITLDPKFEEAYLNLALAYRHERRFEDAIFAFQRAAQLDPKCELALRELGLTYYAVSKFSAAKKALETCLALNPEDAWGHLYLALCLQQTGDLGGATAHFAAAVKADPANRFIKKKRDEHLRWVRKAAKPIQRSKPLRMTNGAAKSRKLSLHSRYTAE